MSYQRIIVHHSGHWERTSYVGGDSFLVHFPILGITRDKVLREIRDQLGSESEYMLYYLTDLTDHERMKVVLKNDTDLLRLMVEQNDSPTVYVIEKTQNINFRTPTTQQSTVFQNLNVGDPSHQESESSDEETADEEARAEEERNERAGEAIDEQQRADLFESLTTEFRAWIQEPGRVDRIIGHRSIHSDNQDGRSDDTRATHEAIRNWLIPYVDLDTALPLGFIEPDYSPSLGELRVGGLFKEKDDLQIAVGLYHMENRLEYTTERSCTERLNFVCNQDDCAYLLRARQKGGIWRVRKYEPNHTCQVVLDGNKPRQICAKVLGAFFARRLVVEGSVLKPNEMMNELQTQYGIEIGYSFALRARNVAIESMYGSYEKSYQRLPSYLYLLKERNPGSVYDMVTSRADDRLVYMFLALGQSIEAFQSDLLRHVIVVDGTHLKGKNKGTLFVAVTKDGNEQVFPLAIGLGPKENDESWTWFLSKVKSCFGAPDDLLIVSDQHVSIINAVNAVFPNRAHGLCFYHITKNLKSFGQHALGIFKEAAYANQDSTFDENFDALRCFGREGGGIYRRLCDIGPPKWAKSKCPVPRTSFMTSNPAETMNARLLWARRLPICSMLEMYRTIVEKWFDQHRQSALSREHDLTPKAYEKMSAAHEWGRRYPCRTTATPNLYRVEGENGNYLVDLQNSTCSCREFDLDLMPCRHAHAALRYSGGRASDYVSHYFKQSTLVATYTPTIEPVPHPESWDVPDYVTSCVVRPPLVPKQAGRPRESRARAVGEEGTSTSTARQRCTRCGQAGHNRRVCRAPIPIGGVDLNVPPQDAEPGRRRKKKCSICQSQEHTRPRCPLRVVE